MKTKSDAAEILESVKDKFHFSAPETLFASNSKVRIALDDTLAAQGTIEYVRGSHLWPLSSVIEQFHAPDDPLIDMRRAAARTGAEDLELVPIEIPAGSAVFHHGRTWHGSRANNGADPRRAVVSHCLSSSARFREAVVSPVYSRYKRHGSTEMDESFFPILWT